MFKRIVFFCLMLITSLGCVAQTRLYLTPVYNRNFEFGDACNSYDMTFNLQIYNEISDRSWTRVCYGIGVCFMGAYFEPSIDISFGVGVDFWNFYGILDLKPTIKRIGNGHQVYGDEIAFGIIPKLGIGYNWFITDGIALFAETGFYKEFDVIYTRSDMNVNSFGIYLSIGFRIKDI